MDRKPAIGDLPLAVAVLVTVFGNVFLTAAARWRHGPPMLLIPPMIAFVATEIGLLAVWVALANYSLPVRLIATLPGSAVIFFPFFTEEGIGFDSFAACNLLVLTVATPLMLMRILGGRLIRFERAADAEEWRPERKPLQFTLRQMFGWTLAAAIVAALIRGVLPQQFDSRMLGSLIGSGSMCLFFGIVACGATWASLGRSPPAARLTIVTAAATFFALVLCAILGAPGDALVLIFFATGLSALSTGCTLLMLRAIGYRLVRSRRAVGLATDDDVAATSDRPPNE